MKRNEKQANFAMRNIWTLKLTDSWFESKNDSNGEVDGSK